MRFSRRVFLGNSTAILAASQLPLVITRPARANGDFGPLVKDPDGILDLPDGFRYTILETSGDVMSDDLPMGGKPDGMACFWNADESLYLLVRNHEEDLGPSVDPSKAYDNNRAGGVSRIVVDPESVERVSSNWLLTGTDRNCAGGPSPWGWLSCEESDEPGHGYIFLCDPLADGVQAPNRAPSLGRFKHEAVGVDPETHVVYMTEDKNDSAFYRHVPRDPSKPFEGRLQAMRIAGRSGFDTSEGVEVGDRFEVDWINISDTDAEEMPVSIQALDRGAARINRGEGLWMDGSVVYFTATEGGPVQQGQVWCLEPTDEGGTLTLVAQEEGEGVMINPDNLTVAPWGDLVIAEDNTGPNHLQCITPDGEVRKLARNAYENGVSEFCGVCFSPDGKVMFVNLQEPGFTLAITGPFQQMAAEARADAGAGRTDGGAGDAGDGGMLRPRASGC